MKTPIKTTSTSINTILPRIYLGTMTFGWTDQTSSIVDTTIASTMIQTFVSSLMHQQQQASLHSSSSSSSMIQCHIDTARIYSNGQTEPIVSYAIEQQQQQSSSSTSPVTFLVGTKAHPSQNGGLSMKGIQEQMMISKQVMPNISTFAEYYLHQPDPNHPVLESLQYLHTCINDGTIQSIGMSNYHVSEMERVFQLCQQHHMTQPTVYQGLYNPLNRMVEEELIPLLHSNNCSFIAYNPLAGGLLSGKYNIPPPSTTTTGSTATTTTTITSTTIPQGRFQNNPNYIPRFYTDANFQAISIIQKACDKENIRMVDATYRWLLYHSKLSGIHKDGMLIGASSIEQLQENLQSVVVLPSTSESTTTQNTILPDSILHAFDEGWKITKQAGVFPYWRSYSQDMPNREQLDHGASYNAAKT